MSMPISAAEHAAQIVEGVRRTRYLGTTKTMTARLPAQLFFSIQALADKSEKTKSSILEMLLDVGLQETRSKLSDDTRKQLEQIEHDLWQQEIAGHE